MRRLIVSTAAKMIVTAFNGRAYASVISNCHVCSNGNFDGLYYGKKVKR